MVFSSATFLFFFLPVVLIINAMLFKSSIRNVFLLFASLFFYAWGESFYVLIMIISILFNYVCGILIGRFHEKKIYFITGLAFNIILLLFFKYANFIFDAVKSLGFFIDFELKPIHLPIGISFFTFQSISYLFDLKRKTVEPQKNILKLGLYISLFPQLIAGPIIRYYDVAKQLDFRFTTPEKLKIGAERFIKGLAKKVILADNLALISDSAFSSNISDLPGSICWLAIVCYSLQIYFDFSGYSDMAIGLGKMLGFDFLENFNLPYISKSIQEFWRRWHISLSNWFRDYLYIPLGGNRNGPIKTYRNLVIVFVITGFWHGANWTFLVWGIFHGIFLIIERIGFINILKKSPKIVQHLYAILVVMIGWVFFKSENIHSAIIFIKKLLYLENGWNYETLIHLDNYNCFILFIAIVLSAFKSKDLLKFVKEKIIPNSFSKTLYFGYSLSLIFLFIYTLSEVASSSYSPFIYFRF